jgi:hypothetical protein
MALIAAQIEPHRATRIFFDCRATDPDPADRHRIERTIRQSIELGKVEDDAPEILLVAA